MNLIVQEITMAWVSYRILWPKETLHLGHHYAFWSLYWIANLRQALSFMHLHVCMCVPLIPLMFWGYKRQLCYNELLIQESSCVLNIYWSSRRTLNLGYCYAFLMLGPGSVTIIWAAPYQPITIQLVYQTRWMGGSNWWFIVMTSTSCHG